MKINTVYYFAALLALLVGSIYIGGSDIGPGPSELTATAGLVSMGPLSHLTSVIESGEEMTGGATSVHDSTVRSFGRSTPNFTPFLIKWPLFREGKLVFDRDWSRVNDSPLGPLFSSNSCNGCHAKDGRGRAPEGEESPQTMVVRLSVPGDDGVQGPDPDYGVQLDYHAMNDEEQGEGGFSVEYDAIQGTFADGGTFTLQKPRYSFRDLVHGDFGSATRFSQRVAPAVFGLGLLESVPARTILALADPGDRDGDGISGRPNLSYDVLTGRQELGRFGWKASQPNVAQQIARALHDDMGITTRYYPSNTALVRTAGHTAADVELGERDFTRLVFYTKVLAVPKRREWYRPEVLRGKTLFRAIGCAGCHQPLLVTGLAEGYPELSYQTIRPYTDLLLHDMGEGLADDRPDGLANGREWRTPPLWGIGLVKVVNKHTRFLHDGRARNLEEAVLWHGGEAIASQRMFRALRKEDRSALLAFLESL